MADHESVENLKQELYGAEGIEPSDQQFYYTRAMKRKLLIDKQNHDALDDQQLEDTICARSFWEPVTVIMSNYKRKCTSREPSTPSWSQEFSD